MDSIPTDHEGGEAIPYHALLCEVLSALLGVRCCARSLISALLSGELTSAATDVIYEVLGDDIGNF
jgi:hypothetical protein